MIYYTRYTGVNRWCGTVIENVLTHMWPCKRRINLFLSIFL